MLPVSYVQQSQFHFIVHLCIDISIDGGKILIPVPFVAAESIWTVKPETVGRVYDTQNVIRVTIFEYENI